MQKIAVIALTAIILLQCCIKTGIVTYFHLNHDFIASTLCENKGNVSMNCKGKCYLTKKINEQEKRENKLTSILKDLKDGIDFLPSTTVFSLLPTGATIQTEKPGYRDKFYSSPLAEILQPPC
jgi:hypothetical protein